jgi:hypothetical protein
VVRGFLFVMSVSEMELCQCLPIMLNTKRIANQPNTEIVTGSRYCQTPNKVLTDNKVGEGEGCNDNNRITDKFSDG